MQAMPPATSRSSRRSGCPISIALETLGDAWTLLIVRDLMFKDRQTYNEFLHSGDGIASNILADRLLRLEAACILDKRTDPSDARRYTYSLSAKGIDLAPVLVELILWSARHETSDAPAAVLLAMRRGREAFIAGVRERWRIGR
jgi:DNA-binding HxlR family transcriptional regulator